MAFKATFFFALLWCIGLRTAWDNETDLGRGEGETNAEEGQKPSSMEDLPI